MPGIYTKLLDVDKVDIIVSGYGTNLIAPAMPVAIRHDRLFLGLFALAVNSRVPLSEIFLDVADRARPQARLFGTLFQGRDGKKAEAARRWRPARRRCRVPEERIRGRPRQREGLWAQDRLR